jgi:hypothetical protein
MHRTRSTSAKFVAPDLGVPASGLSMSKHKSAARTYSQREPTLTLTTHEQEAKVESLTHLTLARVPALSGMSKMDPARVPALSGLSKMDPARVPALSGLSKKDLPSVPALTGTSSSGDTTVRSTYVHLPVSVTTSPKKKKRKENHHEQAKARAAKVASYAAERSGGIPSYIRLGALISKSAKKLGQLLLETHSSVLGVAATKMSLVVKASNVDEEFDVLLKLGYGVIESHDGYPILGCTKDYVFFVRRDWERSPVGQCAVLYIRACSLLLKSPLLIRLVILTVP